MLGSKLNRVFGGVAIVVFAALAVTWWIANTARPLAPGVYADMSEISGGPFYRDSQPKRLLFTDPSTGRTAFVVLDGDTAIAVDGVESGWSTYFDAGADVATLTVGPKGYLKSLDARQPQPGDSIVPRRLR